MYLSELPGPRQGTRQDAIDGHIEIGRRCRELGVDTIVVFDTHWLVNASYHINCAPHFKGTYTSNELPHFISNMPFEFPGNPGLGNLLAAPPTRWASKRWPTTRPRSTPNTARWCRCAT
jgi:3,4-dihydroxyphenylacetate 2,3-dioxygenase